MDHRYDLLLIGAQGYFYFLFLQIVKDAIKRIQVVSKTKSGPNASSLVEDVGNEDEDDDSSDGDSRRAHYSSSLLQKFVESTERLSGKRNTVSVRTSGSKHSTSCG